MSHIWLIKVGTMLLFVSIFNMQGKLVLIYQKFIILQSNINDSEEKKMDLFENEQFYYRNGELYCEGTPVEEIIEAVGSPAYIYSRNFFADRYKEFNEAFAEVKHSVFFAVKANFNLNVMKTFSDMGCGLDVNSAGELFRAQKTGVLPGKIIMSGVGKTYEEIKLALEYNIKLIKAESLEELRLIDEIACQLNVTAPVALRVNPDVDAKTHPYISTGLAENKFGIQASEAEEIYAEASGLENISLVGMDMHIGSQITTTAPFVEAVEKMVTLFKKIRARGIPLNHFDIGGGMGVRYKDENVFTPKELAASIMPALLSLNCEIMFEPGRYFTANGGILVAEVLFSKKNGEKNFIITDVAMTELIRPSLYSAYHHIQPLKLKLKEDITVDIVGPVCESSDFMGRNRVIESLESGDKIAIMSAGAYGMVMASNYNGRRRPPEVLVDDDKFYVIRNRETYENMLLDENLLLDLI